MGEVIDDDPLLVEETVDHDIGDDGNQGVGDGKTQHTENGQGQAPFVRSNIADKSSVNVHT